MRKRVAIEMVAKHERTLRRTARRYSICVEDADDAFQRALEILLVKAPPGDARELIRWMQTVTKHEALAVRRSRVRHLGSPGPPGASRDETIDWVELIPTQADGPAERVERHEAVARSREALMALKPAELRALTLLAEGYSYAEIGEITGFSQTKVNRCLAEGRERFRSLLSRSESGARCAELGPVLSAFCDGEAGAEEAASLREHLRACAHCRAAMRAYRAAPHAAAVIAVPIASRSLLERAHEAFAGLQSRLAGHGAGAESAVGQVAASGGARGAGMAALAKVLAVCAGTAGGAAACVAAGVVPSPATLGPEPAVRPTLERTIEPPAAGRAEPAAAPEPVAPEPSVEPDSEPSSPPAIAEATAEAPATETGAIEYAPPPTSASAPASEPPAPASAGSPAGEFGP